MLTFLEARGSLSGGLSTEPSSDPLAEGPSEQDGEEHHRPTDFLEQTEGRVFPQGWGSVFSVSVSSSEEIPLRILFLAV